MDVRGIGWFSAMLFVSQSVSPPLCIQAEKSTTITGWIFMKFCEDVHGAREDVFYRSFPSGTTTRLTLS